MTNTRRITSMLCGLVSMTSLALAAEFCYHLDPVGEGCGFSECEFTPDQCIYSTETDVTVNQAVNSETQSGKTKTDSSYQTVCSRTIGKIDSNGECSIDTWSGTDQVLANQVTLLGENCNPAPGGGGGPV